MKQYPPAAIASTITPDETITPAAIVSTITPEGSSRVQSSDAKTLKKNALVHAKLPNSENWEELRLTDRAGKTTGKYKMCWNTESRLW